MMDQHQHAYKYNRSTEDAVTTVLCTTQTHPDDPNNYARILFIDYSSAFNTIIPRKMIPKLFCMWVLDFLSNQHHTGRLGMSTSSTLSISTGAPQGCVLSLLSSTVEENSHDCPASHDTTAVIKFTDDTSIIGLIKNNNETAYREEVKNIIEWPVSKNLDLNKQGLQKWL